MIPKLLLNRNTYVFYYSQNDGTMKFPDSSEGELLELVHLFLMKKQGLLPVK